jgi:hypothetical protein
MNCLSKSSFRKNYTSIDYVSGKIGCSCRGSIEEESEKGLTSIASQTYVSLSLLENKSAFSYPVVVGGGGFGDGFGFGGGGLLVVWLL